MKIFEKLPMIIRPAIHNDVPAIAKVSIDTWRTAYRSIIPDEHLDSLSYERRANGWHEILSYTSEDGNFVFVAEDEFGEIVGFADGGSERTHNHIYKGELYTIYILQTHQRKGIGNCLMQAVVKNLESLGINSMLVWVLADNHPARQFYVALGGKEVDNRELEIGGKHLIEVAYGWTDIGDFQKLLNDRL